MSNFSFLHENKQYVLFAQLQLRRKESILLLLLCVLLGAVRHWNWR